MACEKPLETYHKRGLGEIVFSRFMKLMLQRPSRDWQERRGHPVALVESFVDPQLCQGTAHKVSGWSHLGKTAGWKREVSGFYINRMKGRVLPPPAVFPCTAGQAMIRCDV